MFARACPICNSSFESEAANHLYCSSQCKSKAERTGFTKQKQDRKCGVCGKVFTPKYLSSRFCSRFCVNKQAHDHIPRKTSKRYNKTKEIKDKQIPQKLMNIIYGAILGDGYLHQQTDEFHRLSLCHSDKQLDYIKFKMKKLNMIFRQEEPNKYEDNRDDVEFFRPDGTSYTKAHTIQYHAHSISHPDLSRIYDLCYGKDNKQRITRNFLDLMDITSLLIWYLDDGSMSFKGRGVSLFTQAYTKTENKIIRDWLLDSFGIKSKIRVKPLIPPLSKKYFFLSIPVESTKRLLDLFKKSPLYRQLPKSMRYKFKFKRYKKLQ